MLSEIYKITALLLKFFFGSLAVVFFLWTSLVLYNRYDVYGQCAKLPNGAIVTYEAYLSFSNPYLIPIIAVKAPDGTQFSRGDGAEFYFSATTAWWVNIHYKPHTKREPLAYRPDVGLVSAWENPDLYHQLKREAGEIVGAKMWERTEAQTATEMQARGANVRGVWRHLRRDPKYSSRDCHMDMFTFKEDLPF